MTHPSSPPLTSHPAAEPERWYIGVVIITAAALLAAYFVWFIFVKKLPTGGPETWGQFGDYIGGLLNPIVGLVTITLLVSNLRDQRKVIGIQADATRLQGEAISLQLDAIKLQTNELAAQREQLEAQREEQARATAALQAQNLALAKQSTEQSLFSWLRTYREMVSQVDIADGGAANVLKKNYHYFHSSNIRINVPNLPSATGQQPNQAEYFDVALRTWGGDEAFAIHDWFQKALAEYEKVVDENGGALEPILASIPAILAWIDQSDMPSSEKWKYAAIVRSHLSWLERVYLLFYGCTDRGLTLAHYANKYALFSGLTSNGNLLIRLIQAPMRPPLRYIGANMFTDRWPYQPTAFDQVNAQAALHD